MCAFFFSYHFFKCRMYYPDEKKQKMKQWKSKFDYGKTVLGPQGLSTAVDFRLELGLQMQAELRLRVSKLFFLITFIIWFS